MSHAPSTSKPVPFALRPGRPARKACLFAALVALSLTFTGVEGAERTSPPAAPRATPATPTGQAGQSIQVPQPQPSFRTSTTTIEVDVIVRDKNGRFVTGLTPADFEVTEEGASQQIQTMYLVEGRAVTPAQTAGAESGRADVAAAREALPTAAPARVFVLFFDQEHLDPGGFKRLQDAAVSFLKTDVQEGDIAGVLLGGTMMGNRLTADREELVKLVQAAKFSPSQAFRRLDLQNWPRITEVEATRIALFNDKDVLEQVVRRAGREAGGSEGGGRGAAGVDYESQVRSKADQVVSEMRPAAGRTVQTLLGLLNGLGRIPGRKTVVFMTDGFWVEESWGQLRSIVNMAGRANVRFYSVDAQGLRRGSNTTDLSVMGPMETATEMPTGSYDHVEDGPNSIAWDTGGYYIRKTNDFKGAFTEIAADTSTYYVLGYTPSAVEFDGKFHQIRVRVKRDGLTVRARKGYIAVAPAAPAAAVKPPAAPEAAPTAAGSGAAAVGVAAPPAAATAGATGGAVAPPVPGAPTAMVPAEPIALRPDSAGRVRDLASGARDSGEAKRLASEGWDRYSKGDLEGAETLLAQAVEKGAAPWAAYALGFSQVGLRKPLEAVRAWGRVLEAVPEFEPIYLDLADVYVQLSDTDKAIETLRAAERRWPADVDVLNALGTIQVRRDALPDAIESFEKAAKADPKDPLAFFNLARTYELRYFSMRRFSRPTARWADNPELLQKAIENYEVCTQLGGPYEADARAAVDRLRAIR